MDKVKCPTWSGNVMKIHPTAVVDKDAKIGRNVSIGPYCVIEGGVEIGDDTRLWHNAYVAKGTTIGKSCSIHMSTAIGHEPQDIAFENKPSFLKIGDRNTIREFCTIHRGTEEGSSTVIGDDNFIMGLVHIAHNCRLGSGIVIVNNTILGGHVVVEDSAFISGNCVAHQFVKIGKLAMLGGAARMGKDVPPFMIAERDNTVVSYNLVGLRRAGYDENTKQSIKKAFSILYRSDLSIKGAVEKIDKELDSPEVKYLLDFIRSSSKRGICTSSGRKIHNR